MTEVPARQKIVDFAFGAMAAEVLFAAAELGVADRIGSGGTTAQAVAGEISADGPTVARLLRAMASMGLLEEPAPGTFRLTEAGGLLREDCPDSLLSFVKMFGDPAMLAAWRELPGAVRTGRSTFEQVHGAKFFDHLAARPELSAQFNAAMRQGTELTARQLPSNYDFSRFRAVADVGGGDGDGTLLASVLRAWPTLRGVLFDTEEGLAQSERVLAEAGVGERVTPVVGDFFKGAPDGADLYILKSVIHDWDDAQCAEILGHVRRAVPPHGRVLVVEPVLPASVDGTLPQVIYLSDLNMLVNVGGRERTLEDFQRLFENAGFRFEGVTALPRPSAFSLIEASPTPSASV